MEIWLIRHGETDWNVRGLYQGTTDVALNARGRAQARDLAARLAHVRFDAAYTSPLARARDTAACVLGDGGPPAVALPALREISYGLWQGRGSLPRGRCNAGLEWRWRERPWSVRFPGGESLEDVAARAVPVARGIVAAHPAERVLLSGHGHLNRVLLIALLGWERDRFWRVEQPNAGCWRIRLSPGAAPEAELLAPAAAACA